MKYEVNHTREHAMQTVAFKIQIQSVQWHHVHRAIVERLGESILETGGVIVWIWPVDRGPIPNLCDLGVNGGIDVEQVFATDGCFAEDEPFDHQVDGIWGDPT